MHKMIVYIWAERGAAYILKCFIIPQISEKQRKGGENRGAKTANASPNVLLL